MTTTQRYLVVANDRGERALWPALRGVPAGWKELASARTKDECLDFVRGAPAPTKASKAAKKTVGLGLFFFGGDEGIEARNKYRFVLESARIADQKGFSAVWLPERHFTRMGSLYPNPAVLHAALARETKNLRLRAGSVVLPLHEPLRVAEEWAVVDNLSDGRVEIAFAPGWNPEDFVLKPGKFAQRYDLLYAGIDTVRRLWRGEEYEALDGNNQKVKVRTYPTPIQPELPFWVTAASSPRSFEEAGKRGANLLTHLFDHSVEELAGKLDLYRKALAQAGHKVEERRIAVALHTFVADTEEEVLANAYEPFCNYLKSNVKLLEFLAQSKGLNFSLGSLSGPALDEAVRWMVEKFLRQRSLLGTPDAVRPLIENLGKIGVHEIACLVDFGPTAEALLSGMRGLVKLKESLDD